MTLAATDEKKTEETDEEEFIFEPTHTLMLGGCRPISDREMSGFWRRIEEIKGDLND